MRVPETRRTFDDALDALGDAQRRKLLVALLVHNPQDDSPDLDGETVGEPDAIKSHIRMEHVHLPKLEAYGFIEWDKEANEVSTGPNFEEIKPLLELLADHEDELPHGWM